MQKGDVNKYSKQRLAACVLNRWSCMPTWGKSKVERWRQAVRAYQLAARKTLSGNTPPMMDNNGSA
jgi:hypothetical protein